MDVLLLFSSLYCFLFLLMLLVCYDLLMWHFLISINILNNKNITSRKSLLPVLPAVVGQSVECRLRGMGGHGLDLGPPYTKVVKMVLAWHSDLRDSARTGRLSIRIVRLDVVSCQVSGP